jgi:hypothetical protein
MRGGASSARAASAGGTKKLNIFGSDAKSSAVETASATGDFLGLSTIPRVAELGDTLESHKYSSDMKGRGAG